MRTAKLNNNIIEGYLSLLNNLSQSNKLKLISRLNESVKTDVPDKKSSFKKAFGALESNQTAEEIIDEIKKSRLFNREIESF